VLSDSTVKIRAGAVGRGSNSVRSLQILHREHDFIGGWIDEIGRIAGGVGLDDADRAGCQGQR
jgi:hypothetical protein